MAVTGSDWFDSGLRVSRDKRSAFTKFNGEAFTIMTSNWFQNATKRAGDGQYNIFVGRMYNFDNICKQPEVYMKQDCAC